jgi:ankyrin repeat protein
MTSSASSDVGADPDALDSHGISLLQNAANDGRLESAAALVEAGANVDLQSGPHHWTALHYAASRNNARITQLLLDAKADPNAATPDGERPMHTAAFAGDLEVVMALVGAGADVTAKNNRGHTAMEIATLRAEERFQFAQAPFVDIAVYLKKQMEAAQLRADAERAQQETVAHDIAVLKSRHPGRFRLKPR